MVGKHTRLLLIEDNPADARLIREMFKEANSSFELEWVQCLSDGLERLAKEGIDAVLLDLALSDSQGLDTLLRVHDFAPGVPIIVLTVTDDEAFGLRSVASGAQDYLVKDGLNKHLLLKSTRYAIERKKAEEQLRESESRYRLLSEGLEETVRKKVAQLQQAESLAAIGQMVSVLAHEIRNPLQTINMGVESMRKAVGEDEEKLEILEEISHGVNSLNSLVSNLLEYSKPVELHYSSLSAKDIVSRTLKRLGRELRHTSIELELEQKDRKVSADVPKIVKALINLVLNAIESMPDGGSLKISSHFSEIGGKETLKLYIADTGYGINIEDLVRIGEPFFTTKTVGTGLGIPLAKKIIEAHGGSLKIESRINEGTVVEISLPVEGPDTRSGSITPII